MGMNAVGCDWLDCVCDMPRLQVVCFDLRASFRVVVGSYLC